MLRQAIDAIVVKGIADEQVKRRKNVHLRGIWNTEDGMVLLAGLFERIESLPATQQPLRGQSHSATSTGPARGALATLAALCRADGSIAGCDSSTHLSPAPSPASNGSFTGGYDTPSQASLLDRSLTNGVLRSLAALVLPGAAMSPAGTAVARERCSGGRHIEKMDDSDNRRRRLFSGVLKLLQEIAREDESQGVERVGRRLGQEDTNLVWDAVIVGLSDSWSEIRKLSATHARSLAATLGPANANAFYLRAAAKCNRVFSSAEVETPRDWKRTHGLLLGMRAALEGASACADSSSYARNHTELDVSGGKSTPLIDFADGLLAESASGRDCIKEAPTPSAVEKQRAASSLLQKTPPPLPFPVAPGVSVHTPPPVPLSPPCMPTTAKTTKATKTISPLGVALACLAHRQLTVREAAVGLLYVLALTLGPQAALALYNRIVSMLESNNDNEARSNIEACVAGRDEVATGKTRAEERRMCDQASGALGVLERLLDTVPPETVGQSWERVFLVLRSYIDHPMSSLRRAAGAVLLRIAATTGTAVSPALLSFRPSGNNCRASTTPGRYLPTIKEPSCDVPVERNASARIVLSALVTAWQKAESRSSRSSPCVGSHGMKRLFLQPTEEVIRRRNADGGRPSSFGDTKTNPYNNRPPHQQRHGLTQGVEEPQAADGIPDRGQGPSIESEQQRAPGVGDENVTGETVDVTWTFHEGVLMVYEGVLKMMVDRCLAGVVPSTVGEPTATAVTAPSTEVKTTFVGATEPVVNRCNWPIDLVAATPALRDLLNYVGRQAESALYQAELRREACCVVGETGEPNLTTVGNQTSPGSGTLELWRAGSQLLPTLAKAMAWWNPEGLLRACERAALVTESKAMKSAPLLLKRRTLLSIACELLRASASHARHLAEICTDRRQQQKRDLKGNALAGSTDRDATAADEFIAPSIGATAFDEIRVLDGDDISDDDTYISVTSPERWGSSADGILDSGSHIGGSVGSAPAERNRAEEAVVLSVEDGGTSQAVAAAQVVCNTLTLCRDAPPLLIQSLAGVAGKQDDSMDWQSGTHKEDGGGTGVASTSACGSTCSGSTFTTPGKAASLSSPRHRWVFTGVVEALVLAAGFRSSTSSPCSCSQAVPRTARNSGVSVPSSEDTLWGREGDSILLESKSTTAAEHMVVNQQLHLLHKEVFPANGLKEVPPARGTGSESAASYQAPVESNNTGAGKETVQAGGSGHAGGGRPGETATVNGDVVVSFAVPFSWGSLSIVRTPLPFRNHPCDRQGHATTVVPPSKASRAAQRLETARQAVQLDRLLSARIVRALPGYARSLPREIRPTIVPCLLRWLEARDEKVRWISLSPLEARASLLSAIHIALSARNSLKSSANTTRAEQEEEEEEVADVSNVGQHYQQSVALACVETLTRMMSEGRVGSSLFSPACLVAKDAVIVLLKVSRWSCSAERECAAVAGVSEVSHNTAGSQHESPCERSPQQQQQQRRQFSLSAKGRSERGTKNSPYHCATLMEYVVSPMLHTIAEHLLRWYPRDEFGTERSAACVYDDRTPARDERVPSPQRVADGLSTTNADFVSTTMVPVGDERVVVVGSDNGGGGANLAGCDSGGSGDDDDGGGGNDWDDWDDEPDNVEDGTGAPAAGIEAGKNNIAGGCAFEDKLYTSALASIVDLLSPFMVAPTPPEEAREVAVGVTPGVCHCFVEHVEHVTSSLCLENHHQSSAVVLQEGGDSARVLEEGKRIGEDDRYTIPLDALLNKLPARHRDAIVFAWRRGLATRAG